MSNVDSTAKQERVRELLHYNPDTGLFMWRDSPLVHKWRGKPAGRLDNGYLRIRIDRREYQAHRLAWLYMTGEWPFGSIDHINGVKSDNRWCNLRDLPQAENMQNRRSCNIGSKSGHLGVKWNNSANRWEARITVNGTVIYLGRSTEKTIAAAMYVAAKRAIHRACTLEAVDM